MNMNTRIIIFDFDGTLADTRQVIVKTQQQTMRTLHLYVPTEQESMATIGLKLKCCFLAICPSLTDEQADECVTTYQQLFRQNKHLYPPVLFPHVRETLEELKRQGFIITIASSRSSFSLHELVNELRIEGCIDFIVGADEVVNPKPDAEPVLMTLQKMGCHADEALVVGDMPVDILMGRHAGTRTCAVTYGNATREQLTEARADVVIDDMQELLQVVGRF